MIRTMRFKIRILFFIVYFILLIKTSEQELTSESRSNSALKVNVNRNLENDGFHRYLNTQVEIESNETHTFDKDCRWMIIENFNTDAYVDVYELKMKNYEKMYKFFLSNKVNTETAGYKSQEFQLFIYVNNNIIRCNATTSAQQKAYICKMQIKLPIHLRYNLPSLSNLQKGNCSNKNEQFYYNFTLRRPRIYVNNCLAHLKQSNVKSEDSGADESSSNLLEKQSLSHDESYKMYRNQSRVLELPCERNTKSKTDYLIYLTNYNKNKVSTNDSSSNETNTRLGESIRSNSVEMCTWNEISYKEMHNSDNLLILVPVGDQNIEGVVLVVTLVVLTFFAFSIAKCVRSKSTRRHQLNLNEQKDKFLDRSMDNSTN